MGMDVEYEHGSHDPQTDVTHDDPILTGTIGHMKDFPDYYERLERIESEASGGWAESRADPLRLSDCCAPRAGRTRQG
jgi:hypothetical protein